MYNPSIIKSDSGDGTNEACNLRICSELLRFQPSQTAIQKRIIDIIANISIIGVYQNHTKTSTRRFSIIVILYYRNL